MQRLLPQWSFAIRYGVVELRRRQQHCCWC
eukprot:SAG22_NODE_16123_length_332_cov_1.042918_1_plen_29_part_01